tara:strand:+ start:8385 stop:9176 length:792 start_codon:yes stop_codon:yes gene_type:complete
MKHKIAVAISVYDKLEFVKTNLNIFKNVWQHIDPFISICCNHEETFKELSKIDGINVVRGLDHPFERKEDLRFRQYDCIKKSVANAANHSDYVIHWHADAFALDDYEIVKLIEYMEKNEIYFSGRGFWKKSKTPKIPFGDIDDHFFILKSSHVINTRMYEDDPETIQAVTYLANSGVCSEGILATLVQGGTPDKNVYIYSDMSENQVPESDRVDKRYKDNIAHRTLPPFNFDPIRKFLHCDDMVMLRDIFIKNNIDESIICEK